MTAPAAGKWQWTTGSNQEDAGLKLGAAAISPPSSATAAQLAARPNLRGIVLGNAGRSRPAIRRRDPILPRRRHLVVGTDLQIPAAEGRGPASHRPRRRPPGLTSNSARRKASTVWRCSPPCRIGPPTDSPHEVFDRDGTLLRNAWRTPDNSQSVDMHNEGGRPFLFPGKVPGFEDLVPDYDRLNPEYFQRSSMPRWTCCGTSASCRSSRCRARDTGPAWGINTMIGRTPMSATCSTSLPVTRRTTAIFSPIHYDYYLKDPFPPAADYNVACNAVVEA